MKKLMLYLVGMMCSLVAFSTERHIETVEHAIAYVIGSDMDLAFIFHNKTMDKIPVRVFSTHDNIIKIGYPSLDVIPTGDNTNPVYTLMLPGMNFWIVKMSEIFYKTNPPPFCYIIWNSKNSIKNEAHIYIMADNSASYEFTSKYDTKNSLNFKIAKIYNEKLYFSLIITNTSTEEQNISGFFTKDNSLKIKFPDGKIYEHPIDPKAGNITLKPGESKYIQFDIEELLKENKDFSMENFKYGLSELIWEIKQPDGKVVTKNFWLIKFNGELPHTEFTQNGYHLDGPLAIETFRDKKIKVLDPPVDDIPSDAN